MCVISYIINNGRKILFKNRDRYYHVQLELIHELIDGVEVLYIHDKDTNWCEGLNEHGIGLVNSSLLVIRDEDERRQNMKGSDGEKILHILSKKSLLDGLQSLISFKGHSDIELMGHTILSDPRFTLHIERTTQEGPYITIIKSPSVFTNHGIYSTSGYTTGIKHESSHMRKYLIEQSLSKSCNCNIKDINKYFNKSENIDCRLHPYRSKQLVEQIYNPVNKKIATTTCQLMLNLTDLFLYLYVDTENCTFDGIVNRLPNGYVPKLRYNIYKTNKQ